MAILIGGDLRTGLIRVRALPATSARLSLPLNRPGTLNCDVKLPWVEPESRTTVDLTSILIPGKSFLGFEHNGVILDAGPIWSDEANWDDNTLTYAAGGIESLFDYRYVMAILAEGQLPRDVTLSWTTSLRTHAKRLAQTAIAGLGGELPIVFEDDIAGSNERNYKGSDKVKVSQALANLRNVENGPDIAFRARHQSDRRYIEWVQRTGTPLIQDGPDHTWDASTPGSTVSKIRTKRSATTLSTTDYETGSVVDGVLQEAVGIDTELVDSGFPRFETANTRSSVIDPATLQEHADGEVIVGRTLEKTITFSTKRSPVIDGLKAGPWLGDYQPGDMAQLVLPKNPFETKGRKRHRIMQIDADLSDDVTLTCMPERVSGAYPNPVSDLQWVTNQFRALQDAVDESTRGRTE